jgi:signal peptidase I
MLKAWSAGLGSFILPGLGFIYAGRRVWAYLSLVLLVMPTLLFGWTQWVFNQWGGSTYILALVLIYFCIAITSCLAAIRQAKLARKNLPWHQYLLFVFIFMLLMNSHSKNFIRSEIAGFNIYRHYSASMLPTIEKGDVIVVDTNFYEQNLVKPGEVVMFIPPEAFRGSGSPWLSRVVAVENDRIALVDNHLKVNGKRLKDATLLNSRTEPSEFVLKDNQIFLVGDNRLNSNDSRFWGPLSIQDVRGKAISVVMTGESKVKHATLR